ncbi:glycosyltransferase family 2 protein [Arthrospira platensis]|uniref:glycosyltransferase family 2 protein n=2 Tax=Sirenicapillariaceae TaxID=2934961 RepID=UPI000F809714|nr:glycosyltransferase family 92 protein [Arthrospira platensis]MBD2668865.1 glycosyltransferase family 2 protein [Arthrospira platensis FACHB-439]MBD2709605.1 glycosyltransferase family 2 protein [Arthrospira platensis FACHB-835]MDT9183027.1 glycosyltransferase family 92 protein [Limnospira sp. PMC 289.06]MDT9309974.1 glycosyltransferase family 92 protein [Limnospira sp. Paracas R14]QQW27182.1 glycosyltransferase family 92 protein [Arthrospira sp. PCC 9108]
MSSKTILCTTAKNESPYLVEWIAYHRLIVGFDQIIIYDNDSHDDSLYLLQKLAALGLCKFQQWPRVPGQPPQQSAYNHVIQTQKDLFQWVCFLDMDEFLVLKNFKSIHDCIKSFENRADSILFNWLMFGSGCKNEYLPELVTKRFVKCAPSNHVVHKHVKCISKIDAIQNCDIHIPVLKPGSAYFHIDGTELKFGNNPTGEHIREQGYINHEPGQINHYQSKSLQEYKCRKLRGRATVDESSPQSRLKPGDFDSHNSYSNTLENHDILTRIIELENHVSSIYASLGGKQQYDQKFMAFIQSEAQRYDRLYNPSSRPLDKPESDPPKVNLEIKNPRENERFLYYKSILQNLVDVKTSIGLEIGAFDRPFVPPNQGQMHYADYRTTQELKELAKRAAGHNPNFVVDVTYNLSEMTLSDIPVKYDYIVASHVTEHTPNMIGFLNQIADLLTDTGLVFLIIPDKRYTFDFLKPLTSLGEILENNLNNLEKPAFRHVFNSQYYNKPVKPADVWAGKINSKSLSRIPKDVNQLILAAEKSKEVYIDTHCNIFTDLHFYDVISELIKYNIVNFYKAEVYQVKPGFMDFLCILWKAEIKTLDIYNLFPELKSRLIDSYLFAQSQKTEMSSFSNLESIRTSLKEYKQKLMTIVDDL